MVVQRSVADVMTAPVISVSPETPLQQAVQLAGGNAAAAGGGAGGGGVNRDGSLAGASQMMQSAVFA